MVVPKSCQPLTAEFTPSAATTRSYPCTGALSAVSYSGSMPTLASCRCSNCMHGGLTRRERSEAVGRFTHGDARLLLATDAGSEGLNLHHRCRLVVNLELPWTPLRLEQRAGRVDRI